MKSIFKLAAASLGLVAIAAVSTPALAGPARVEISVGNGYYQAQAYPPPRVVYEAPAPVYRYRDDDGWRAQQWREHEWRERERREHYWRERNEWRERQWQEQRGRDRGEREGHYDREWRGDWR